MKMNVDITGLDKLVLTLRPDIAKKTLNRTLNDLMVQSSNAAKKNVRQKYNIKAKQLNKYMNINRSNPNRLEAKFNVNTRAVSLFNFASRSSVSSNIRAKRRNKRRPIKVKVLKGGGMKKLNHAFLMMGKNNNIGIFERVQGTQKIKRLNTVGPATMFEQEGVDFMNKFVKDKAMSTFKKNFNFYIGKV